MITQIQRLITQMKTVRNLRNLFFSNLRNQLCNTRGAIVLSMTIIVALLCAIACLAVLQLAIGYARQGRFFINRTPYRFATEAGIVWAQEQLWANPAYCGNPDPPVINGVTVDVAVTNCGAGNVHTISAKATY